jgi:hypothetical protein
MLRLIGEVSDMLKFLLICTAMATPMREFTFLGLDGSLLKIKAVSHKEAARACFNKMTEGRYQGEEKSLDIIDRCANPLRGL